MVEFIDIRRKVGNQVLRAYLLDGLLQTERMQQIKASLRGPKNDFQDFARYIVVRGQRGGTSFAFLAETGVYENLRIVGTESHDIAELAPEEIISVFTEALRHPEEFSTVLAVSSDSRLLGETG